MVKDKGLNDTLNLVQNAIDIHNYKTALNNLKSLHFVFNKNDMKYPYLINLESNLKKLYKMYFEGGNSTDIEKAIQFADSYIGLLRN